MKRLLALLLTFVLFAAACGGSDDDAESADTGDAASAQTDDDGDDADDADDEAMDDDEAVDDDESASSGDLSVDEINVAYFEQWPTPNLLGFNDGSFDEAVGAKINWVPFGGGGAMSEAMEAGDIDISYSQGLTPFANTVNNGADIKLVGIAVTYAEADNCVAQGDLGVTRDNAAEVLQGATIMSPQGNVTNFKMLSMMDFLGVDIDSLEILPTDGGATTAAAFADGAIDVGCSFGGSLVAMQEESGGELIMTGAEQAADIGINTYDIVSIPTSFGEDHGDAVIAFLAATEQFNNTWAADPEGTNDTIADASGMEDVGNFLGGPVWFGFPSLADQLTDAWLGGTVAQNMTEQIQTFVDLGQIDSTIGDFSGSVDPSFAAAAADLVGSTASAPAVDTTDDDESASGGALSVDEINVAYFEQWPTPNLLGFNDGSFDEAVGAKINWIPFGGGGAMSEAMEAGDIDISYSQGLTPFANTVNNGADIKLVGIAVTYAEADNCVAQGDLGVTRDNAAEVLQGATVMSPQGNVTNFKMLSMMDFLGVDISSLTILPTDGGATTAAAFADGAIDVGCSFGGSLVAMQEESGGELIMTGAEQAADIGINTYDIVSIPTSFGEDHGDAVVAFLQATQRFNDTWAADPEGTNGAIADASGMEDVGNFLGGPVWFGFPNLQEQLTDEWLGGTVAANMTEQIQTFVDLGQIDSTIGDFSGSIDTSFLEEAAAGVEPVAAAPGNKPALDVDEINVAYFEQWPTPNLLGFNDGSFDEAVGAKINWIPFGGGGAMSEAMEAGDIDISYSQGLTPFANTVNNGADIKLVGIAVAYAEADNCVAQGDLGVTRDNAAEVLQGATVMSPQGNVTNFKMLSMMDFLGVDISSLTILPTDGGATTAAAFADGSIDVGCSFGGSLVAMQEESGGELIMTGAEQAADIGINTYDIVSIPTSFGDDHPQAVINFLQATQEFNDAWAADPAGTNGTIADASGMEDVGNFLSGPTWFSFPDLDEQLTDAWMGATVAQNMTEQIQTFVDLGQIDSTIGDFSGSVDTSFLEKAAAG